MRTIETTVYLFSELSDSAKEKAREWYRAGFEYGWSAESLCSIKTFCDEFGVRIKRLCVDDLVFECDADNSHFRGRKLKEFRHDAMPTGYHLDLLLREVFHEEFTHSGDAKRAFNEAVDCAMRVWQGESESEYEFCDDAIIANEYEFTESGRRA